MPLLPGTTRLPGAGSFKSASCERARRTRRPRGLPQPHLPPGGPQRPRAWGLRLASWQPIRPRLGLGWGWVRPIGILERGGTSLSNLIALFLSELDEKFGTFARRAAGVGGQRRGEAPEQGSKPPASAYLVGGASGLHKARGPAFASFHLPGRPSSSHPRALSQVKVRFLPPGPR